MTDSPVEPLHVYVLGLDDYNRRLLGRVRDADDYRIHPLLGFHEVVGASSYDMEELLQRAVATLTEAPHPVAGVFTYWDFPSSTMIPVIRRKMALPGSSLESVLRCEHKYWSRLEQQEVMPEMVPRFAAVHPFADDPMADADLDYPFWLKPVRSHSSHLGFHIGDDEDLRHALERIREGIHRFAEPFNHLMSFAELHPEMEEIDGYHCIAEEIISGGDQCTLEGYVLDGETHVYGVVDSLSAPDAHSFARYQYPSRLADDVVERMEEAISRFLAHAGYDGDAFNAEFYHDPETDEISFLEINCRTSKSHFPLFEMVDGRPNVEVPLELSVLRTPDFPQRGGSYAMAAKFMLRTFEDGVVESVPDEEDIRCATAADGCYSVKVHVEEGQRLKALEDQDSYSFEYGSLFVGGDDAEDIEARYQRCVDTLGFEIVEPDEAA